MTASNTIDLCHESFGPRDAPAIVLVAGLGTQMIRWTLPFCEMLVARGFRVIRYDNRDAGLSTACGGRPQYTLHDMAADTIALLDTLGIARAHLAGRSMGGMIAQLAAASHPERVLSLTTIMSSTGNRDLPAAAPDVMAMMTRPVAPAAFLDHSVAFARRIASPGYPFNEDAQRALIQEELRRAQVPGGFGRQLAAIAATGDMRPLLAAMTLPTLVVHGADDPLVPAACGVDIAAAIPGAELLLVDGMGHDLPPALYQLVADGIARTASAAFSRAS